jgi:glycosyltransferase involved in cell wall biosynthesis
MRVAVLAPRPVPYFFGGAQRLSTALVSWIAAAGHDCRLVEVESPEGDLPSLLASYAKCGALDLAEYDLVVSTKYPTWMVEHPNHVVYMIHPLRGLYDTYAAFDLPTEPDRLHPAVARLLPVVDRPPERAVLPELFGAAADELARHGAGDPTFALPGPLARTVVRFLDRVGLDAEHVRSHWAISRTVAGRPGYFPPNVVARAAIPPSSLAGLRRGGAAHLLLPGRLDGPKRVELVVDAMGHVPGALPLKIAGIGPLDAELRERASGDPRIEFLGAVDDAELAELYADALAVPFVPLDEDLGLVALEAMACATPVVTCRDSGGPCELVLDERSGLVVAPEADELGSALARLVRRPELARELGENGRERARRYTPEAVVGALLGDEGGPRTRPRRRHGRPGSSPPRRSPSTRRLAAVSFAASTSSPAWPSPSTSRS